MQPDLFTYTPPSRVPLDGDRDGATFEPKRDRPRLNKQAQAMFNLMADGRWRTLREMADATGYPEASIGARLRDFRKGKHGDYLMQSEPVRRGLWRYRLDINKRNSVDG